MSWTEHWIICSATRRRANRHWTPESLQSLRIGEAQWIPMDIAVQIDAPREPDGIGLHVDPPRRESTVSTADFLKRGVGLRAGDEDGAPRGKAFLA